MILVYVMEGKTETTVYEIRRGKSESWTDGALEPMVTGPMQFSLPSLTVVN